MADGEVKVFLPSLFDGQRTVKSQARRYNVVLCGRRWGKSTLGIDILINAALYGFPVAWFSPTNKMLKEVWRTVFAILSPIIARANETEHRIDLITGGVIDMWSLDGPEGPRGRKYKLVIIDEAAVVRNLKDIWYAVIRPTLTDYRGNAWFLSTPRGYGFFKTIWDYGQDHANYPDWRSWHFTSYDNPHISTEEIDSLKLELPERTFSQEIMASFLDQVGGVFRNIRKCATAILQDAPKGGQRLIGAIDWGRVNDFTWITLMDIKTRSVVNIDYFTQVDYETQINRIKSINGNFKPLSWLGEYNSMGGPLCERLTKEGVRVQPFLTTSVTKARLIDGLVLGFENKDIKIPDHEILINQLESFEVTMSPSGLPRYSAPSGGHDDGVISLALAYSAVKSEPIAITPGGMTTASKWKISGYDEDKDDE